MWYTRPRSVSVVSASGSVLNVFVFLHLMLFSKQVLRTTNTLHDSAVGVVAVVVVVVIVLVVVVVVVVVDVVDVRVLDEYVAEDADFVVVGVGVVVVL